MTRSFDRSSVSSFILDELEHAFLRVLNRRLPDLRAAAEAHTSVENLWLQSGLAQELRGRPGLDITVQKPVTTHGRTKWIDIALPAVGLQRLVELKAMPTNYGLAGNPITQLRDALRSDPRALDERVDEQTDGCLAWLAYPIPAEREGDWRINHLRLINRDAAETRLIARLNVGQAYVHAYISEARGPAAAMAA